MSRNNEFILAIRNYESVYGSIENFPADVLSELHRISPKDGMSAVLMHAIYNDHVKRHLTYEQIGRNRGYSKSTISQIVKSIKNKKAAKKC